MRAPFVLVIDVGSTSIKAALLDDLGHLSAIHRAACPPLVSGLGLSEFDPVRLAKSTLEVAAKALAEADGSPVALGISNQRCSTVLWRRSSGEPLGPGLGWADLRTAGMCLDLQKRGLRFAPNQTATKAAHLLEQAVSLPREDVCLGTLESWLAWHLSEGTLHVTDATNAAIGGLCKLEGGIPVWDLELASELGIPGRCLPEIIDSGYSVGQACALSGSPMICALLGDQQASLIGTGCVRKGDVKITFGTGGMLDMNLGGDPQEEFKEKQTARKGAGSYPIVAWQHNATPIWGLEAMMFAAGSSLDWFCNVSALFSSPAESHDLAATCPDSDDVGFIPLLDGLASPEWDFGARGALLGLTTATNPSQIARALLEGVAHRGADLIEAAETDAGCAVSEIKIDGGMSSNRTFVQTLANASGCRVLVAAEDECSALGVGFLAGMTAELWEDLETTSELREARAIVEPSGSLDRDAWRERLRGCREWHPELSAISF